MPKVRARRKSKGVPHTKGQTLEAWIEAQYRADPGLRRRVNAMVREMEREQDAVARARAKKRRARKARAR